MIVLVICLILLMIISWRFAERPQPSKLVPLIPGEEPLNPVTTQLGSSIRRDQADGSITTTGLTTSVKPGQSSWVEGSVNHRNGEVFGNHGSIACDKEGNRYWGYSNQSNRCLCMAPFYGSSCQLESYDQSFYALGTISPAHFTAQTEIVVANNLSFDTQGIRPDNQTFLALTSPNCTNLCLADPTCVGVYYTKPDKEATCQLLHSVPTVQSNLLPTMSSQVQPTLFLRKGLYPMIEDQAFLFYTEGNDPSIVLRPWLSPDKADGLYHKVVITDHTVVEVPFYPSSAVNNTGKQLHLSSSPDLSNPVVITSSARLINVNVNWSGPVYAKLVG